MHLPASTKVRVGIFALLVIGSLGLKAALGPPRDTLAGRDPKRFNDAVLAILHAQNFFTVERTFAHRSDLILGERGDCHIAVRDAKWGSGMTSVFAEDVRAIGPVQYLYRGGTYEQPPGLWLRAGRFQLEITDRLGLRRPMHVLVAFAKSPACGDSTFGLGDVTI